MVVQKRHTTKVRSKEIVVVARELIAEVGVEKLTIRAIAKKVGITQTAIYRHFKNKKQILLRVAENFEEVLLANFNQAYPKSESYINLLETSLRSQLFLGTKSGTSKQLWIAPELYRLHDENLNKKMIEGANHIIDRYKESLSRGIEAGEIRKDINIDAVARIIFIMSIGLISTFHQNIIEEDEFVTIWDSISTMLRVNH